MFVLLNNKKGIARMLMKFSQNVDHGIAQQLVFDGSPDHCLNPIFLKVFYHFTHKQYWSRLDLALAKVCDLE